MQQTDVRIASQDLFSLQLQNQTQHSVGSGMLRSKVDGEVARIDIDAVINIDVLGDGRSNRGGGAVDVAVDVVVVGSSSSGDGCSLGRHEFGELAPGQQGR